jgi:hypothetical protein
MSESQSKRIKLDIDINDFYDIIYHNYLNKNYDLCIKYYENTIQYDNNIDNNILLIIKISYFKLNNYNESTNIFINNKNIENDNNIYDINFYNIFNIKSDTNYTHNKNLISTYIDGYAYKNMKNIDSSIIYFESCFYTAKESVLINIVKNISDHLIELYESNVDKYFNELKKLYQQNSLHIKYIELIKTKNMYIDSNNYIKQIINDELNFIFNDNNDNNDIDYYLDNYVITDESDILYLLDKYKSFGKMNKIRDLINKTEFNNNEINFNPEIYINILYEYVRLNDTSRIKYCGLIFDLIEKIENKSDKINNILNEIIEYYNAELYYSNKLGSIKYKKYLNRRNLDNINNNYCIYLNLYKYFNIDNIEKNLCVICLDTQDIIKLNCHETHIVCPQCYKRIDKCPMCRDVIHK